MNIRYAALAAILASALALGGIALAGGGDERADGTTTGQASDGTRPSPLDDDTTETTDPSRTFVGLSKADAIARAQAEGRTWRIATEDGEAFALTDDLDPGRVTFDIEHGIVTDATVEAAATDPSFEGEPIFEDAAQGSLVADAVARLVTLDNSFGGRDVFDEILVGRFIDGDATRPLQSLDLELIAGALEDVARVTFVDDPDAEIQARFENPPAGAAVVSVTSLLILDDRAEVGLNLWCGSLCGVFLTYEAEPAADGWSIVGPTGPIAVS
jgi:hypothetical protein